MISRNIFSVKHPPNVQNSHFSHADKPVSAGLKASLTLESRTTWKAIRKGFSEPVMDAKLERLKARLGCRSVLWAQVMEIPGGDGPPANLVKPKPHTGFSDDRDANCQECWVLHVRRDGGCEYAEVLGISVRCGIMNVRAFTRETMASGVLPLRSSWCPGNAGMRARPRVHNARGFGKVIIACAAAERLNSSSAETTEPQIVSPQQCTYGARNVLWLASELQRLLSIQRNPGDGLVLTRGQWSWDIQEASYHQFKGLMQFCNTSSKFELFVPEVSAKLQLLSKSSLDSITATVQISPQHPNENPPQREDGYWRAYITRAGESTAMQVVVDLQAKDKKALAELQAVRVDIDYISYGPHGRTAHSQHIILPVRYAVKPSTTAQWRKVKNVGSVLPIRTHILSHLDDPLQVLKMYVLPHSKDGDIIAIGETPLAIMQGRFRHPKGVHPGLLAKLVCRLFHPTSSLATACGMQSLIDITGRLRVVLSVMVAVIARLVGVRGMFYRLAGPQARLIDDVTGTLPPYDQFITLGPIRVQETVDALKAKTGCEVAVVDVNDLKKVQILAASDGVDHKALESALLDNPAGNADEQTPLVLVRKSSQSNRT